MSIGYAAPAMHQRTRSALNLDRALAHLGLLCVCAGFALPFIWMVSVSLKTLEHAMEYPPQWIPSPVRPQNYWAVLTNPKLDFPLFTRNTIIIAALSVAGTLVSSSLVAYGFAKIRFRGRGMMFVAMLSTMMIPFPVTMVSLFSIYRWVGDHTPIQ